MPTPIKLFLLLFSILAFTILGIAIGRYELLPISHAADTIKAMKKDFTVMLIGKDKFVKDTLNKQYHESGPQPTITSRSLDTSRLPLLLATLPLAETGQFAASDELIGGSLARIENSLVVMDRLGNIFRFDNNALHKLDYGLFPNQIGDYITDAITPLPITSERALYIAYDQARSTIFVSLQRFNTASRHVRFNVSSITIDKNTFEKTSDWKTIFESEDIPDDRSFRGGAGGRLVVAGSLLYFSIGDYNFGLVPDSEFGWVAQNSASSFGKIYEYDLDTHKTHVKSIGHRNPQGMVFTRDGKLIDAEQGPEGGDELNIIVDGNNYGWPYRSHGTDYGTFTWTIDRKVPAVRFAEPIYAWVPDPAISPLLEVASFHERWDGDLLAGSLKAQSLFRLRMVDDRVIFSEPIWVGHRVRDMVQMPHQIVLITDDPALVFVTVDEPRLAADSKMQKLVEFTPALTKCLTCHHFGETNPTHLAPTLANILNKRIASDSFQHYSDALKGKTGIWDEAALTKFLTNPGEFVPGSSMPAQGLSTDEIKRVISAFGIRESK